MVPNSAKEAVGTHSIVLAVSESKAKLGSRSIMKRENKKKAGMYLYNGGLDSKKIHKTRRESTLASRLIQRLDEVIVHH